MPVAVVSQALVTPTGGASSISTASITVAGGNYVVGFSLSRDGAALATTATFDGNAATAFNTPNVDSGLCIGVYGYAPAGNGVFQFNFDSNSQTYIACGYALLSGVDTGSPSIDIDFGVQAFGASLDITAVTGGSASDLVLSFAAIRSLVDATLTSDQTELVSQQEATSGSTQAISSAAGSASISMGWNWTGGAEVARGTAIMMRAASAGGGTANLFAGKFGGLLAGKL